VRGYKEEGTITTAFDMTVLNDLDRFHLVIDASIAAAGRQRGRLFEATAETTSWSSTGSTSIATVRTCRKFATGSGPYEGHSAGPLSGQFRCAVALVLQTLQGKPTANAGKRRQHRFPKGCAP